MMKYFFLFTFAFLILALSRCQARATAYFLVRDNQPRSVIVAPSEPPLLQKNAIAELQYHLHRASGVMLQVIDEKQAAALPNDTVRIRFNNEITSAETYRVQSSGNQFTFSGDSRSDALLWAVDYFLDTQLGVRWLWPGDLGTYVPQHADITLPKIDYTGQPKVEMRRLRNSLGVRSYKGSPTVLSENEYQHVLLEGRQWLKRFQMGSRSQFKYGHAFTDWWKKYSATHPEYFAVPPSGHTQKGGKYVKLNVGNPSVDDAIIAEWKAAGAPNNWNVCPNDNSGFDTSAASRAMDDPPNQDPELIWTNKANLTARYVKFWNRLIVKMRRINPNVTLSSYAYSSYRSAPLNGLKVEPGIVLGLVPTYWAQKNWLEWQQAGAHLFLRPNWWALGGGAPVIPLHRQGEFFKFALSHNMVGFDFDSLHGAWATEGALYYVIARLSVHPEMPVDDAIDEYCSAFGNASSDIKSYLHYWEQFSEKAAYSVAAGGEVPQPISGLYTALLKEHGLPTHPLVGSVAVIPYLYTDDVLKSAYAILDEAAANAMQDNTAVKQRIQFLREGLDHLKLTRDVLKLGYSKNRTAEQQKQYDENALQLQKMRHRLTLQHVIWGEVENVIEARRNAPTFPSRKSGKTQNWEGM